MNFKPIDYHWNNYQAWFRTVAPDKEGYNLSQNVNDALVY